VALFVENIRRIVASYRPYRAANGETLLHAKPYFTLGANGELELHNVPVPREPVRPDEVGADRRHQLDLGGRFLWLRDRIRGVSPRLRDLAQRLSRYQPLPSYGHPEHPDWLLLRSILTRWADEAQAPLLVMPIPFYSYVEETSSATACMTRFEELSSIPGLTVHNPLPEIWKLSMADRRAFRFANDVHPTRRAHRFYAESLCRTIQPMLRSHQGVA
jgi:hypothetical protein